MAFPISREISFEVPAGDTAGAARRYLVEAMASSVAEAGARRLQVGE